MSHQRSPIYLLADSQLLFWRQANGSLFLQRIRRHLPGKRPIAAYIGAANGDEPAYFELFEAAMHSVGIEDCHMIHAQFPREEQDLLKAANLILLAGGDPALGWHVMEQTGMTTLIHAHAQAGTTLMGISAGAVQLGLHVWPDNLPNPNTLTPSFQLVPALIDAHQEATQWARLRRMMHARPAGSRGLGIPSGGGIAFHPDQSLEVIRRPACEFIRTEGHPPLRQQRLNPAGLSDAPQS